MGYPAVLNNDFKMISHFKQIDWNEFEGKTFLISGATGLIGSYFVRFLRYLTHELNMNIRILCIVRNVDLAKEMFEKDYAIDSNSIVFIHADVTETIILNQKVDYILHTANPTSSIHFIEKPVETIETAFVGTQNMLELAKNQNVNGFVYLSSMEVYGTPPKDHRVSEEDVAGFNPEFIRNCYPISKQVCESLCCSYVKEYGVPVNVLRLTQTFGPGVKYGDGRVFAEFMRCAIEGRDIVLKTKGETERSYLYLADAVSAICTLFLCNKSGECYTAANPRTYCSILDMAEMVAQRICHGKISVKISEEDSASNGYANTLHMMLDVSKLESLGWEPKVGLSEMFERMIEYFNETNNGIEH